MKYLRSLVFLLVIASINNSSLAFADTDDSVRLLVYQSSEDTAKIVIGSKSYLAPISFETGLAWSDVKDAYHVPPAYALLLKASRISIYIDCSGAEFHVLKRQARG